MTVANILCASQESVCKTPLYESPKSISDSGVDEDSDNSSVLDRINPFRRVTSGSDDKFPLCDVGFIDTHCHLDYMFVREQHYLSFRSYIRRKEFPSSFRGCITCFCDPPSINDPVYYNDILAEPGVWGTFGCHPHNARLFNEDLFDSLLLGIAHKKCVGFGEIGLDYTNVTDRDKVVQQEVFVKQLHAAVTLKKTVVIHGRHANEDVFRILKEHAPDHQKIHYHCYTGSWELAEPMLDYFPNLYLGVTGTLLFTI